MVNGLCMPLHSPQVRFYGLRLFNPALRVTSHVKSWVDGEAGRFVSCLFIGIHGSMVKSHPLEVRFFDDPAGQVLGLRPTELRAGDAAVVRLKPLASLPALCVEAFEAGGKLKKMKNEMKHRKKNKPFSRRYGAVTDMQL